MSIREYKMQEDEEVTLAPRGPADISLTAMEGIMRDMLDRISVLERGGQCTAENPHRDMSWSGGYYFCRCGMRYVKQPPGKIRAYEGEL